MWANMGVAETSIILWKMCTPESNKKIYIEQKKEKLSDAGWNYPKSAA